MRKEVFFAIFAGISIGLTIAFGAWKLTQAFKKNTAVNEVRRNLPPQNKISLSISNLTDFDIVTDNPFVIAGIINPKSAVVISTLEADYYGVSNEDGSFEIEVELPAGLSEINVNETTSQSGQKVKVVYSSEFSKYLPENNQEGDQTQSTESAETKDSLDLIREKIKDEVAGKSLKKTAYVGTITDISSGTIQIKSVQGDIKQMSLSEDTSYINTLKKNAEVKATDLAIGDYIVSMGFVNGNKVLNAKRILISEPMVENKFKTVIGTISSISKTKLTTNQDGGETTEITLPKKWVGPNISELEEGQRIITVGEMKDETYTLRTIFTPEE